MPRRRGACHDRGGTEEFTGRYRYHHHIEPAPVAPTRIDVRPPATPHPVVAALMAQGWNPLHAHTGVGDDLAPAWPTEHLATLPDDVEPDDERRWLVRSPWPSLTVDEAIGVVWSWVERPPVDLSDLATREARIREVLTWSDDRAREWFTHRT